MESNIQIRYLIFFLAQELSKNNQKLNQYFVTIIDELSILKIKNLAKEIAANFFTLKKLCLHVLLLTAKHVRLEISYW